MKPLRPLFITALCSVITCTLSSAALAKLPAPDDAAKAKAAEAAPKAAWSAKVDAYKLCNAQDRAAANFFANAKTQGQQAQPAQAIPACADPGAFVAAVAPAAVVSDSVKK